MHRQNIQGIFVFPARIIRLLTVNKVRQMDFDKYRYHLSLMDYRESSPSARLSALRHDIHQPMGTLCGMAQLLQFYLAKSEVKPQAVQEFQATLQAICATLRDLH